MSQTEVQLIKDNAVVEADIANDAVTRDKINVVSTSSAPGIEIKGDDGSQEGYLQLNCRVNSHGVKIQSPPHSASQSYKIILPDNQIAADKILKVKSITGSGSTATGQLEFADAAGGITEADCWRITTAFETSAGNITANWERADDYASYVGTGMTESSGVFTFPSTGVWHLSFFSTANASNARTYVGITIKDNTSGNLLAEAYDSTSGSNYYTNLFCECFFDVTDTSNNKIFTRVESTSTTEWKGSSNRTLTAITFIRLGDT